MIQYVRRLVTLLLPLAVCFSAYGQNWPLPSKTPRTTVPCVGCSNVFPDGLTVGYEPGITFTGRYLDSNNTSDYQGTFRTGRAASVYVDNAHNRVYMRIGSAIFAYSKDTFFQRLENGETLLPSTQFPVQPANARLGAPEVFLKFDEYFYPEYNSSKWKTVRQDGQDRVLGFDVDEAGYVYVAASIYGWGIVQDKLTTASYNIMPTLFQRFPQAGDPTPVRIVAAKSTAGTRHYAFVSAAGAATAVWDVSNRSNPSYMTKLPMGIQWFAKSADHTLVATVDYNGTLGIYPAETLANGGSPLYTEQGVRGAGTDGTNFFTTKLTSNGLQLVVLQPNGPTYTRREYPLGGTFQIMNMQQSEGYIVLSGLDAGSAWDTQVYKLSSTLVPSAITIKSYPAGSQYPDYFRSYYSSPPSVPGSPTYLNPGTININDGTIARTSSGKTYLIISGYGIGDVYELPSAAGVNITATNVGQPNPYTSADRNVNTYYSDLMQFIGTTTDTSVGQLAWNFGNTECNCLANSAQTPVNSPVTYQYAALSASTIGAKTVTATGVGNSAIKGTTVVNLTVPQTRIKIAGTSLLFTQPNASSPAPIVVGDFWADASDGRIESHYDSWTVDGVQTKAQPNEPLSVGGCGTHTLSYQALYGPYTGSSSTLTSSYTPLTLGINGTIGYSVRPFAASVDLLSSSATDANLSFRGSSSRASGTANISFYEFALITPDGSVSAGVPPATGAGLPTLTYTVPKSYVTARGMRVRLTLKSNDVVTCPGVDAGTSVAYSQYLNGPDPAAVVQTGNCDNGGPCSFTINSQSGVDTVADGWTYQWEVLNGSSVDASAASYSSSTAKTFVPTFTKVGTYTVRVTVKNAIGTAPVSSSPVVINTAARLCSQLGAASFNITWTGTSSNCAPGTTCQANETINFIAGSLLGYNGGYDPLCAAHTLLWTFGDGTASQSVTVPQGDPFDAHAAPHIYSVNNTYTVTLKVTNAANATYTYTTQSPTNVQVGSTYVPPDPPPTNSCANLSAGLIGLSFSGSSSGCTDANGQSCKNSEALTFAASYSGSCANTYTWDFGDGSATVSGTAKNAQHAYANSGSHFVVLKVQNPSMGTPITKTLVVTTGDPNGSSCGQITPNVSLWIDYRNASNTCSSLTPAGCVSGDALTFAVKDYMPYNISCATHTYDWDFGDGSPHANTNTVNHAYAGAGTFVAKCIVSNGPQTATLSQTVVIGGQGEPLPGKPDVKLDFAVTTLSQATGAYVYLFTPTATPEGIVTRYVWNFGDGKSDSVNAPGITSHLYPDSNKRSVMVTAYDARGNTWTHTEDVPSTLPRRRGVRH